MTGLLIYATVTLAAVAVFIGTPLLDRRNGYHGRHIRK